jgi:glutamine synthetase
MHTATYIWIDGTKPSPLLRSKTRVFQEIPEEFPQWNFDGSSTNQATGRDSDRLLKPVRNVPSPLRRGDAEHWLVLCEVLNPDGTPHESNHRAKLREAIDAKGGWALRGWFGFEQEYTLFRGSRPLGFPKDSRYPPAQGPYYCGVGGDEAYGRELVEEHLQACLDATLRITGINAEVMPGQWEFQCGGPHAIALEACDHLWLARWLLHRIGEKHGVTATLDPKPVPGDWNGAGMHTNFSTEETRKAGVGLAAIEKICTSLSKRVGAHLAEYGDGYEARLTGAHETASYRDFTWGVSDRTASVRIPAQVAADGCGYLEDRRPNANACPYRVARVLLEAALEA